MHDLTARISHLYAGDPGAFVTGRTALAKEAKVAGETEVARAIGKLRKPTRGAWLVNLLAAAHGDELAGLLDLAAALREAHATLDADQLRSLSTERNRILAVLANLAVAEGAQRGYQATAAVRQEVVQTLQAGMTDAEIGAAVGAGILAQTAQPAGFGPLPLQELAPMATVVPLRRPSSGPANESGKSGSAAQSSAESANESAAAPPEPQVDPAVLRRAERALARAELDLADAADGHAEAAAELAGAEQAHTEAVAEVTRLQRALAAAQQIEAAAADTRNRAQDRMQQAARAQESARAAHADAERLLEEVNGGSVGG